jgi:hypothetical protein
MLTASQARAGPCDRDQVDKVMVQRNEQLGAIEARAVRDVVKGNSVGVFFVDIFNGLMPIPTRFVQFAREPGSWTARPGRLRKSGIDGPNLDGSIHVGLRSSLDLGLGDFEAMVSDRQTLDRYGLNIVKREFRNFSQVVIYNEKELIVITGSNPLLWEAMLDVWFELKSRSEP